MKTLNTLKPGDSIEIIAPASRCSDQRLVILQTLIESWGLTCLINEELFGNDVLCANSDEKRFSSLVNALNNAKTKAVICARGGYGSMRLIPFLSTLPAPSSPKLFIGMSDITALHLYFNQAWGWSTILGSLNSELLSAESIAMLKAILFGQTTQIVLPGRALNACARNSSILNAQLTGGNLCLLQTSIGTAWQLDGRNKIIFFEEIDERGYRVDRMLEHLRQANCLKDAAAIVFGDFIGGNEANGNNLIQTVLERFAEQCEFPVVHIQGVGHGSINFPLILGAQAKLQLGSEIELTSFC